MDVAAYEILQEVIAVEAAASLAELGDPRPDTVGCGPDRDPSGRCHVRAGHQLITGKGQAHLIVGGTPP